MTNDQLGKALVAAGLLPVAEVKSLWAAIPADQRPKDGKSFAELLVAQGKLTKFQATELLSGSATPLILGDYQMQAKIGAGGMGQVFKAQHRHMKRTVAIKLLPAELTKDEAAIKRFQREVEAAAKLSHPNIVQAYDASTQRGVWYLVMEYVEGRDLAGIVAAEGSLPIPRAVNYIRQSARGLGFAHENGVVHRDIKPANLLLDKKGTVKILDMGLARFDDGAAQEGLTQSGQVMGTVDYMAPEQAFDTRHADARADVYSLGCTLFRLLTAQNMYEGESLVQKLMGHQSKPIPKLTKFRPDVPPQLEAVYERMVAKDPKERYQTMGEVVQALAPFEDKSNVTDGAGLTSHFEGLSGGGTATNAALLAQQTAAFVVPTSVNPTVSINNPLQSTDPVSARSIQIARDLTPQPGASKRSPGNRKKVLIASGGLGAVLAMLLGIWVIIKDKDGNETARLQVPEGGSVEVKTTPAIVPTESTAKINKPELTELPGPQLAALLDSSEYEWSKPENLGASINSPKTEMLAGISADERTIYFYRQTEQNIVSNKVLMAAKRASAAEAFPAAEKVESAATFLDAAVSADQLTYAVSLFPDKKRREISWADRRSIAEPFPKLQSLSPPGDPDAAHPVLSADGRTLLATCGGDIFSWTRAARGQPFAGAQRLSDAVNKRGWEMPAFISNDRLFTIVMSQARSGPNSQRLITYHTRAQESDPFGPGKTLDIPFGPAQDSDSNSGFRLTGDGQHIYFTSALYPGGRGWIDLWVSHRMRKDRSVSPVANATATLDLIPLVDLAQDQFAGEWGKDGAGFMLEKPALDSWIRFPVEPGEEYSLRTSFSNTQGNMSIVLPLEGKPVEIFCSTKRVELALKPINDSTNPKVFMPFEFNDGKRHEAVVEVTRPTADDVKIVVTIDGTKGLEWQGTRAQLRNCMPRGRLTADLTWGSFLSTRGGTAKLFDAQLTTTRGTAKKLRGAATNAATATLSNTARWPLAPSKADDLRWLHDELKATLTLRTGPNQELLVNDKSPLPNMAATIVGIELHRDSSAQITDEALARIATLTDLEALDCLLGPPGSPATQKGLAHLTTLKNLRRLQLSRIGTVSTDAAFLAAFRQLEKLTLQYIPYSGWEKVVGKLPALQELWLHNIDRANVSELGAPPRLTRALLTGYSHSRPQRDIIANRLATQVPWCCVTLFDERRDDNVRVIERTAPPPNGIAALIPAAALTFNGHRYLLVEDFGTWQQAKAKAEALDGHLVTINSVAERDFVRDQLWNKRLDPANEGRKMFLGASNTGTDGAWAWVTGEPLDKTLLLGTLPQVPDHGLIWSSETSWSTVPVDDPQRRFHYLAVEWDTAEPANTVSAAASIDHSPAAEGAK